ncbi:alpha/beta hydrolase [uncultured Legionella sp.]|uniref:alpha/beta fold hydrolase n=1 Tax=uncultured Legionella sp. TaxID=210934 RepID=UPI002627381E|nr:alpha/beta hydrolase [uncultured Legionella sp.]
MIYKDYEANKLNNYFWDENSVRYQLINFKSYEGQIYNWLFLPGGPGADSSYLFKVAKELELPGNTWLIDFPNNGSNQANEHYNFNQWFDLLLPTVNRFQHPVLVGQSFGGMFPLLFPQLETILKGFVILNSSPTLWHEEASRVAKEKGKPSLVEELQEFVENQNPETFKRALMACAPYYFPNQSLEKGKQMLESLPFNYQAAGWWQQKASELNFNAVWVPENVQTLIIGGSEDCMTPPSLFLNDQRFVRDNISTVIIENAGHMPWVEDMSAVKKAFVDFIQLL